MKWVECIPNFSEGQNLSIIEKISQAIRAVPQVYLLNTDIGYDANRTVFTFVGDIRAVEEAAFRAVLTASQLVNMQNHHGEHPRMGACDVCPFVPLGDTTMDEVIQMTYHLGKRLGEEGIPVYLYEKSARQAERANLSFLRKGEYESLQDRLGQAKWKPDYGPTIFVPNFGIMALGARPFLIAYNVNLESKEVSIAKKIAREIRASGGGLLPGVKAIGWWMEAYQCAQVSTNITDIHQTDVKKVFDTVRSRAAQYQIEVKSSELIGMIPEEAILNVGKQILGESLSDKHKYFKAAFQYLGLKKIGEDRILERVMQKKIAETLP